MKTGHADKIRKLIFKKVQTDREEKCHDKSTQVQFTKMDKSKVVTNKSQVMKTDKI